MLVAAGSRQGKGQEKGGWGGGAFLFKANTAVASRRLSSRICLFAQCIAGEKSSGCRLRIQSRETRYYRRSEVHSPDHAAVDNLVLSREGLRMV